MLLVLVPICLATVLILFFIKQINDTDKTDKDDLHQYAIYSFIIFSVAFIFPFGLFFFIVLVNKIIKKYNKCFNPNHRSNFISNEFGDLVNPVTDPNLLLINNSSTNQLANAAATTANHTSHHHSQFVNSNLNSNHQQIDLQTSLQVNLQGDLQGGSLQVNLPNGLQNNNGLHTDNQTTNQQISTLNVNQLQYSNNRQLIDEMLEGFDQMSQIDQERTLQRMSSIQRRQRLIRQNAFESVSISECSPEQQSNELNLIYCEDDKPPSYELALLCPKRDGTGGEQQKPAKTTKQDDKKLISSSSTAKPISVNIPDQTNLTSNQQQTNHQSNPPSDTNSTLQTELRNNLENRRRSSNGSSNNTEPPSYDKLFKDV